MAKKLIIKSSAFQKQAVSLLDALSTNPKFADDFIKNPFLHLSKHMSMVDIKAYTRTQIAEVNDFLFNLLSNTSFISWLKKYQKENIVNLKAEALEEQTELRNIIMKDIAAAMLKYGNFGDLEKMFKLPSGAQAGYNPVYDEIFVVIKGVVLLLVVITQIDVTPLMLRDRIEVSQMVNVAQLRKVSATVLKYAKENYGSR